MIFDVTRNASRKDQTAEATRTVTSRNRASLGGSTLATVAVTAVAQPLQRFGLKMVYDTEKKQDFVKAQWFGQTDQQNLEIFYECLHDFTKHRKICGFKGSCPFLDKDVTLW